MNFLVLLLVAINFQSGTARASAGICITKIDDKLTNCTEYTATKALVHFEKICKSENADPIHSKTRWTGNTDCPKKEIGGVCHYPKGMTLYHYHLETEGKVQKILIEIGKNNCLKYNGTWSEK